MNPRSPGRVEGPVPRQLEAPERTAERVLRWLADRPGRAAAANAELVTARQG